MILENFNTEAWQNSNSLNNPISGYNGTYITDGKSDKSNLLIFIDENNNMHLVIDSPDTKKQDLKDPGVYGLSIKLIQYKIKNTGLVRQFIDIVCSLSDYQKEFTEIVKEIANNILNEKIKDINAIEEVIERWQSFWGKSPKGEMSETEIIGLICELSVLKKLCLINAKKGMHSWKGPLREKYDFEFSDWVWEVKGSKNDSHVHIINGIDQLKEIEGKKLAFLSFMVSKTENASAISLPQIISEIEMDTLINKPDLIKLFRELLSCGGYNPVFKEIYEKVKYEIFDGRFFIVDQNFPKLTSDELKSSLDQRISSVRYNISLGDLPFEDFSKTLIGNFFY
jgi:hypothetical protein